MTNTEKRVKFFQNVAQLVTRLQALGIEVMPFSFYRTPAEQATLLKEGKSKTPLSKHLLWLAIDLVIVKNGKPVWESIEDYTKAGEIWEEMGGTWGGRWKSLNDVYHFEWKE